MRRIVLILCLISVLAFYSWSNIPSFKPQTESPKEAQSVQKPPAPQKERRPYRALLEDQHTVIRLAAARVLLVYGDRSGEGVLLEALKGDDTRHRIDAFLALTGSLTEETVPTLEGALETEKNPMARYVMKRTLKKAIKKLKKLKTGDE